jgi:hypothetical protein
MSIKIPIVSDFDGKGIKRAVAEFKSLEKASDKAQFAIRKAAAPTGAALATLGVFAFKAAQKASDLNEETSKAKQIFGDASQSIIDFSNTASTQLGQSKTEALQAAGTFGVLGKAAGLTGNDLTAMSVKFTKLASDLASFNNTSPEEAVLALGAGLRGEAEPLRRYGVLLDDLTLRNKAVELQLTKTTKEALTPANKSLAAQAVILEKTALQQGNFALTSKDAANQQRILTARLEDFQTQLGTILLPVLTDTVKVLNDYAVVLLDLTKKTDNVSGSSNKWFERFKKLATFVLPFAQAIKGLGIVVGKVNGFFADQAQQLENNQRITSRVTDKLKETAGFEGLLKTKLDETTKATDKSSEANKKKAAALDKAKEAAKKLADAVKKTKEELDDAVKTLRDKFADALEGANDKLKEAQQAFDNYRKSVSDSISNAFSFGTAQRTAADNAQNLTDAIKDQQRAQEKLNKVLTSDNIEDIAEAQRELAEATDKVAEAQKKPMTFFESLTKEAQKAKKFGELVNRLIAGDLSEAALQQVLAAGVDAGTLIAEEILGSADGILRANELVKDVQDLADRVGKNAADKYYAAGVAAGTALVEGMQSVIDEYEIRLKMPGLTAAGVADLSAGFSAGDRGFDFSNIDFSNLFLDLNLGDLMGNVPFLSQGGLVSSPTLSVIGESGPEAVIPLNRLGEFGGGMNITVNAGLVSTPDQIGQEIIQAIQKAQRRSGPVFAPA